MTKHTLKLLQGEHCKIFEVYMYFNIINESVYVHKMVKPKFLAVADELFECLTILWGWRLKDW